jgi:hypothetical protein
MWDIIGEILWYMMFITPLFTIPFTWKIFEKRIYGVILGLVFAGMLSLLLFCASLTIIFRNGLGS